MTWYHPKYYAALRAEARRKRREEKGKKVYASKFFKPDDNPDDNAKKLKNRLDQSFRGFSKKQTPEWKFTARVKLENEVSGVRIWRIE